MSIKKQVKRNDGQTQHLVNIFMSVEKISMVTEEVASSPQVSDLWIAAMMMSTELNSASGGLLIPATLALPTIFLKHPISY